MAYLLNVPSYLYDLCWGLAILGLMGGMSKDQWRSKVQWLDLKVFY